LQTVFIITGQFRSESKLVFAASGRFWLQDACRENASCPFTGAGLERDRDLHAKAGPDSDVNAA
jgi:hypothetical protein